MNGRRLALAVLMAATPSLDARPVVWKPARFEELISHSDLVVVGKITEIVAGAPGPDSVDVATLTVVRVLRGDRSVQQVSLVFPGYRRGLAGPDGSVAPHLDPTLVRYDFDQEGVFFLVAQDDGSYVANHPARFKPLIYLNRLEEKIRRHGRPG